MISIYFLCWWAEDVSFQSLLVAPCIQTHTRVVKGPRFEDLTWPELEITSRNPAQARHLFLKPNLSSKAKFTEEVKICATAE